MAVLTRWISTTGTDTASGTNYANAYKTIGWGAYQIDGASDKGGTLYLVNDGTHALDAAANRYMSLTNAATNWDDDWGFRYMGCTSNGTLAMTEVQLPNTNGTYKFIRVQGATTAYVKFEGIKFTEAASADANANVHFDLTQIGSNTAQTNLLMFRYCSFQFGNTQAAKGLRKICDAAQYDGRIFFDHCYMRNVQNFCHDGGAAIPNQDGFSMVDCVVINDVTSVNTTCLEATLEAGAGFTCERNTIAVLITDTSTTVSSMPHVCRVHGAANNGTGSYKDNLYFVGTKGAGASIVTAPTVPVAAGFTNAHAYTFNTSDVDYNAFIVTPACTGNESGDFPYDFPYDPGGGNYKTNDVTIFDSTAADVFNDITSTYDWTVGSLTITLDYDVRPAHASLYTGGSSGGVIGALSGANLAPTAANITNSVTAGQVLSATAGKGFLSTAADANEGDTLSCSVVTTADQGTLTGYSTTTGAYTYTPGDTISGTTTITFKVTDGITWTANYSCLIDVDAYPVVPPSGSTPANTYVDTAPFFRPVLEARTEMSFKNKKNRRSQHNIGHYTDSREWDESTHRVITLATNSTSQVTLGGVATAEYLMVETDNDINVSINDTSRYWPVSDVVVLVLGGVTTVYLQNESTANEAQVILVVSD